MDPSSAEPDVAAATRRRAVRWPRWLAIVAALLLVYLGLAYVVVPVVWYRYVRRHPALENMPAVTHTKDGIPGDPLNVALVGTEDELKKAMAAASWYEADPLGLRSDLRIATDTVLERPYDAAPVSNLYLFGRKEDHAFEQPAGDDPRRRHHVRFWLADRDDPSGRPLWVGAVTYDERVGFSHTTGQITHHIAPDVDSERDRLVEQLRKAGYLSDVETLDGFHKVREGRNGGGDPWHTDGDLRIGVLVGT